MKLSEIAAAVQALATDSAFVSRVVSTARATPGAAKAVVIKAVKDEYRVWREGASGVYKTSHLQRPAPNEMQAILSLAVHTVLVITFPGGALAGVSGAIAKFSCDRIFSSLAWRVIDPISKRIIGMFRESILEAAGESDDLTFNGSAEAERFILRTPALRRASAFSWWLGRGNLWGIAIERGAGSLLFVTKKGGNFLAGGKILERNRPMAKRDLSENVTALMGVPATQRLQQIASKPKQATERIDYKKTKHPNFKGGKRPK